ncbi:MAG: hypothetical protein HY671_08715 [Chloroflexi bacterium]|nr:hypothetical protein [Chloroflexota bacterium]
MSKPVLWLAGLVIGLANLVLGGYGGEMSRLLATAGSLGGLFLGASFKLSRTLGAMVLLLVLIATVFTATAGHRASSFVLVSIGVNLALGFILTR